MTCFSRLPGHCISCLSVIALVLTPVAFAQKSPGPQPVPLPPPIVPPADTPYPGTIGLLVDITDTDRRIIHVHETVPVKAGELTLLYPKWIPGTHSPTGPISKIAGLNITANGEPLRWVRDKVEVFAFHVEVPAGAKTLDIDFQYLCPVNSGQGRDGRVSFSSEIIDLAWNTVSLYPAGHFSRDITFSPEIRLPEGWKYATALETKSQDGNLIHFKETTYNTLVDSPLYGGANFKRIDLSTDATNRVYLDVFADKPADLAITPEQEQLEKSMVEQASKLYASHHYDHYDFLFSLSDVVGGNGLEHHQSSEDGTKANFFTDWAAGVGGRDLLAHEYTHSWNGKFRRPASLWTPNFNVPMQDELLWVYEGMTQYYGEVLTARSGLRTASQTRDVFARVAANFDISPGRKWRPLVDTTNQPTVSQRSPVTWVSWQRPEDYYTEGMLIWLDADTRIREMSGGKKSLDDFARLFFGVDNGSYITRTYTFNDLVSALNTVQPYDWATFLHQRVDEVAPETPKDGITRGGYKLTYSNTPPDWIKHLEMSAPNANYSTSLGFVVNNDGTLGDVWWDSPAFKAGLTADQKLLAVNGLSFTNTVLREEILSAQKNNTPLKLLVKRGEQVHELTLDYHGGLRYPQLERMEGRAARLDDILAPVK